ncbi:MULTISPECIES: bifunctional biotin--[acetyl-CoA-carboxylase] ligase/biotin operon repressor BirA [Tatumella]|mgnify:CR=1 FL=1|uniref:Bifunctional ligase/repressor BirA n=1 Tax=Tatumella punctata TaxID=399969 RepID=A0ABW1VUH4_9GAMM|nr:MULTISPECIES: bifunctional biotin--[acetyl-CoA-carboxylase] ligase/biotin operon repressor BirA [unclassified Tatumella]MBS0857669.1 bifunctional biotin--[acetyl-CoA-carboxylase] ligase/biotin operon repressor BirA [Tatumella sp. JGM16]MBS0895591.1 bifunctional biotin--[acetyl-CoA-carboxylase] ligase/biotin operon repressor BirA [Tatumella sp. JGM130]MBS0914154.1 bifunctional biotin--[acetyl-CoA-carboxylase] ligase/biotin operon repressor BirA [Tatumella sp. JGM91]
MKDYTVPLKIAAILSDGEFHSGEQLGDICGMSRAAINQHIHTLKSWGLDIYTVTGKGYCLSAPLQLLDAETIRQHVTGSGEVSVFPVIDSTNQYLMERMTTLSPGDTCIAEYQQSGRGRRGRQWFSPFGANLYMSMYWRLEQGPAAAMGLSLVVGIVMAEALQSLGAQDVRVKWPNDLYLNDKKLAGILVELSGKTGDVAHIVIGAGINLMMRQVDSSVVSQQWISLQEAAINIDRNALTAELINTMRSALELFETEGLTPFIERWASLDNFINRPVKLLIGEREVCGIAKGIDSRGGLLLEQDDKVTSWVGGEISLRSQ